MFSNGVRCQTPPGRPRRSPKVEPYHGIAAIWRRRWLAMRRRCLAQGQLLVETGEGTTNPCFEVEENRAGGTVEVTLPHHHVRQETSLREVVVGAGDTVHLEEGDAGLPRSWQEERCKPRCWPWNLAAPMRRLRRTSRKEAKRKSTRQQIMTASTSKRRRRGRGAARSTWKTISPGVVHCFMVQNQPRSFAVVRVMVRDSSISRSNAFEEGFGHSASQVG